MGRGSRRVGEHPRVARRLLVLLALAPAVVVFLAPPASADNIRQKKASVDAQLAQVQQQIAQGKKQEAALSTQVDALTASIHTLESKVGDVSSQLAALDRDISLHRQRLHALDKLFRLQTARFRALRREYNLAVQRLDQRLVSIYKDPTPSTIDVVLAARSFQDVITQIDYLGAIASQDKHIALKVALAKAEVAQARLKTKAAKKVVYHETRVINGRAQQVEILKAQLVTNRNQLASARGSKANALAATQRQITAEQAESQALQAASAQLAAQLQALARGQAPAVPGDAPKFIWPVEGPITSPYGMRWGTLHPGIDIGVPSDTPVHAAAAGKVVWCGWMSGYGNLVMIDHGGGYATAYGHNTSISVSCGQDVTQGETIALSGCTGFCTGPHVHFEVRVNGNPVDPLGYLP